MKNKLYFFLFLFIFASRVFAGAYEDMEEAFIRNDTAAAIELINRGMDINTVDKQGNTLLTQSIQRDMPDLFNFLMQKKARINVRNRNGETALSIAAYLGRTDYAKRLIDAGAEINFFGWSPIIYAAYNGHTAIVDYLIQKGADVNAKAENGSTALFFASRFGHIDTVKTLLAHHADPTIANERDETAVDWALKGKNTDIEDLLRSAGGRSGKSVTIELAK